MKFSKYAILAAIASVIFGGQAQADELQQPVLSPVTYTLQDDAAVSPSDAAETWSLFNNDGKGLEITGWLQLGYHDASTGLFNSHPDALNVHQLWLAFDKAGDADAEGLGLGYHFDLMYGTDAADTQAFGNNPGSWDYQNGLDHGGGYGFAMPQAYVTTNIGDWDVQIGHFYTTVGYEVVQATGNFFYSHAKTMYNSEPFTHTGILASRTNDAGTDIYVGWTAGWDTGFDQLGDGSSFLGGFSKQLGDNIGLTYMTTFGDLGWRGSGYSHSFVVDITLGEKLSYVFQSDFANTNGIGDPADSIGVNQYVFYDLNDSTSVGARLEWFRGATGHEYAFTTGMNWRPESKYDLVLRPEFRVDWNDAGHEEIVGIDAVIAF